LDGIFPTLRRKHYQIGRRLKAIFETRVIAVESRKNLEARIFGTAILNMNRSVAVIFRKTGKNSVKVGNRTCFRPVFCSSVGNLRSKNAILRIAVFGTVPSSQHAVKLKI
jgi:hypothetical protein